MSGLKVPVDAAPMYRYRITDSTGSAAHLANGSHIVERKYMGLRHTWTVMDMTTGAVTGSFSGVYVGRFQARSLGPLAPLNPEPAAQSKATPTP